MGKRLLKIFIILTILILLLVTTTVILHKQTNLISDSLRGLLNRTLSDVVEIEYSSLKGNLYQEIYIRDLKLKFRNGVIIEANKLNVEYSAVGTISNEFHFDQIHMDSVKVTVLAKDDKSEKKSEKSYHDFLARMTESKWYSDFISSLPDILIGELEIRHANIQIPESNMTIDDISLDLDGYANPDKYELVINQLTGKWVEKNLDLKDFGCRIDGNQNRMTLNQIRVKLPESQVFSSIDVTFSNPGRYIISLEDVEIETNDLAGLINIPELDSSRIWLDCHIHGVPDSFFVSTKLKGYVNQYQFKNFDINGSYYKGAIKLDDGRLNSSDNKFFFNGEMSPVRNYLYIRFRDFNIHDFVPESPKTNLNGNLFTNLNQLTLKPLTGRGKLELIHSNIDTVEIDSLRFELNAVRNNIEIIEPSFLKFAKSARFKVKGNLDPNYQADLQLFTENLDLVALSQALKIDTLYGRVDANLFVRGYAFDPDMMGYLWVPHFEKDAVKLDSLILQVKIDRVLSSRQGDAYFSMTNSQFGPFEFREARADVLFDSNLILIDTVFMANGSNYISSSGRVMTLGDTILLDLEHFRIFYEQYWIDNQGDIVVRYDPKELNIEQAIFVAPDDGQLEIRGYWNRKNDLVQSGLLMRNMHVQPLEQFLGGDIQLSGVVEGDFSVYDPLNELEVEIALKAVDLEYNQVPLGTVQSVFKYAQDKLFFDEFNLRYDSTRVDLDGDIILALGASDEDGSVGLFEKSQADVKLTWQNLDLSNYARLVKMSRPLYGIIDGQVNLSGSVKDPHGQINVSGTRISYDKFYSDSVNTQIRLDRNFIYLDYFSADLNGTQFSVTGRQTVDLDLSALDTGLVHMPIELDVHCEDDSIEFIGFLTEQVERIYGPFVLDLKIQGSPANPKLHSGNLKFVDGVIELSRVKNPITNVYLDAELEDGILTIDEFSGNSQPEKSFMDRFLGLFDPLLQFLGLSSTSQGVIDGSGTIIFYDMAHPVIDLTFVMNKFYIDYFVENTQLLLSSNNLRVAGRDTLMVTGDVELSGKYVPDLDKLKKNIYLSSTDIKATEKSLGYDLNISMPGNFIITSSTFDLANNFKFEILGDIHVSQKPGKSQIEIMGPLEINSGNYGSWGQDFDIESGQIVFSDPKEINPDLDIRAEKNSRGLTFELSIRGNLEKQLLDLQVRDENNQYLNYTMSDKITLLSLGATSGELSGASLASAGEDVIKTSVETAFSRGAETITGLDKVSIDMEGSLVDLQSMKLNNGMKDASLSLGKYIYSNLYLEYTSTMGGGTIPTPKLSWEPGNQIGLKYRINRNWSINSDYSKTQRGNNLIQISLSWKTTF
jgi:hypothetical protein